MDETERHSALIGDIYDAALDAALWPHVLVKVRGFVKGCAAGLIWKDAVAKNSSANYLDIDSGIEPHYAQLYYDKYIKLDPSTAVQFFAEIGKPLTTADYMPYAE